MCKQDLGGGVVNPQKVSGTFQAIREPQDCSRAGEEEGLCSLGSVRFRFLASVISVLNPFLHVPSLTFSLKNFYICYDLPLPQNSSFPDAFDSTSCFLVFYSHFFILAFRQFSSSGFIPSTVRELRVSLSPPY